MSNQKNGINISPMPLGKLTTLVNYFLLNTTNHLNKLSVSSEEKLNDFDKKLRRLDIMVSLLETKLNSLPSEITNNYPPLVHKSINDLNPFFIKQETQINTSVPAVINQPQPPVNNAVVESNIVKENNLPVEEVKVEEETPLSILKKFLEENPELEKFHKMLKYGVPSMAIETKAKFEGMDNELISKLCQLYKAVNPNPVY